MIPQGYPQIPVRTKARLTVAAIKVLVVLMAAGYAQDHGWIDLSMSGPLPGRHAPKHHKPKHKPRQAPAGTPPLARVEPGSAARMPPARIYQFARGAGFSPDESVTATAIALAESGGRPRAHNPVPPDDSYCLMQVNMLGDLGPARRASYHLAANSDLYDPATCMRVAYGISAGGSNWQPWTTYTRGTYRGFLSIAYQAGGR